MDRAKPQQNVQQLYRIAASVQSRSRIVALPQMAVNPATRCGLLLEKKRELPAISSNISRKRRTVMARPLLTTFIFGCMLLTSISPAQTKTPAWTAPSADPVNAIYPEIESLYIDLRRSPELALHNSIIPEEVKLQLTVRSYKPEVRKRVLASIERVVKGEAMAAGATQEPMVKVTPAANATYNDPALTNRLVTSLRAALGADNVLQIENHHGV
jgi:hypothetical protein